MFLIFEGAVGSWSIAARLWYLELTGVGFPVPATVASQPELGGNWDLINEFTSETFATLVAGTQYTISPSQHL